MFPIFTALIAFLALSVHATPLSRRDVIAPKIIIPNAQTVWPVGTSQTVTWDTSNLPPVSQITNLIGQVILGFNSSDSLNLDFTNPLAKGFKLTDGSVKITVPNVPPRSDYLIVLFGDSGNTSPSFAITQISGGSVSSKGSTTPTTTPTGAGNNAVSTSTLITTPIPITGSVITGGTGTTTDSVTVSTTDTSLSSSATPTTPVSSSSTGSSSSTRSASSSATSAAPTSAAWSVHQSGNSFMGFKTLSLCMASLVMFSMI